MKIASSNKANSLISWVVTLGVALSLFTLFGNPLKRAYMKKIGATANYLLWEGWGQEPHDYKGDETSRVYATGTQASNYRLQENHSGTESSVVISTVASSSESQTSTSGGVDEGAEALLNAIGVTENNTGSGLGLDLDLSGLEDLGWLFDFDWSLDIPTPSGMGFW